MFTEREVFYPLHYIEFILQQFSGTRDIRDVGFSTSIYEYF